MKTCENKKCEIHEEQLPCCTERGEECMGYKGAKLMKKRPYRVEGNVFTINGPLYEFNGYTMPSGSPSCAKRFSSDNPFHGVCRVEDCETLEYRYFLNGKEYTYEELFDK